MEYKRDEATVDELDFQESLHRIRIETDAFRAEAYEMYELPSMLVIDMLTLDGPDQMISMRNMLKLALVNPADAVALDVLSFNELSSAMLQWYQRSTLRLERTKKKDIADIIAEVLNNEELDEFMLILEEHEETKSKPKRKFSEPLNDPGDGIDPLG